MQADSSISPEGLPPQIAASLADATQRGIGVDLGYLHNRIHAHLRRAKLLAQTNPVVHVALAEAIAATYDTLMTRWDSLPPSVRPWMKGAMLYFFEAEDDDHDFDSAAGFDDDAAVLNACLRLANLGELCLNPRDFDGDG